MKKFSILALFLSLLLLLSACGGGTAQPAATGGGSTTQPATGGTGAQPTTSGGDASPSGGKTITVGTTDAFSMDMLSQGTSESMQLVFEGLFQPNPDTGEIEPMLAESYNIVDPCTTTIKLNDNAKFSDGSKVTAADVLYSYERFVDPANNSPQAPKYGIFDFDKCTIQDDDNLTLVTKDPQPSIIAYIAHNPDIVSKAWYEKATPDQLYDQACGSGPYTITGNVSGASTTLQLRSDYWNKDKTPEAQTIIIKYYSDISTMLIDFEKGALDIILNLDSSSYTRLQGGEFKDAVVNTVPELENWYMVLPNYVEAFQDVRVRQAFTEAIDWAAVVKIAMGSLATVPTSNLSESAVPYYKNEGAYPYDPDHAKQLLSDAGFSGGFTLNVVCPNPAVYTTTFEAMQEYLAAVGITLNFKSLDFPSAMPLIQQGQSDLFLMTSTGTSVIVPDLLMQHANASSPLTPCKITDPTYNDMWNQAVIETDQTKAIQEWNAIQDWLHANYWHIPIMNIQNAYAYNSTVVKDWTFVNGRAPELRWVHLV